jgi:hypothetical protein
MSPGTAFPDVKHAREEAIKTASELLRGDGHEFWNGPDWTMRVTDEVGLPVFTIRIVMDAVLGTDGAGVMNANR